MKARIPIIQTSAQRTALNREIDAQLAVHMRAHESDYISLMLWTMRGFGFGKTRLTRLYAILTNALRELEQHYEMPDGGMYLSKAKLKEYGIDIDAMQDKNQIFDYETKGK